VFARQSTIALLRFTTADQQRARTRLFALGYKYNQDESASMRKAVTALVVLVSWDAMEEAHDQFIATACGWSHDSTKRILL
ncbi:hypothetical protein LTR56_027780, partial [Elasticomyces elasticus]